MKGTNYAARHDAGGVLRPGMPCAQNRKTKYEKGESRTGARLQEDAGAFFIRFCAINPISGSKKNGFFQSGGHGASIPRRRHRRDSVHLGRH